jgi:nitroreductase
VEEQKNKVYSVMLRNIIDNRYSGRIWDKEVPGKTQLDYILDCAYKAPSKQSLYPYEIHVITNSKKGRKFKDFLFWQNTWCSSKGRIKDKTSLNKKYNGQYRAPILLCWTNRAVTNMHTHADAKLFQGGASNLHDNEHEQALVDATVSASFAMLAAEEQGLQTSFGRCHQEEWNKSVFGTDKRFYMAVGIGYATASPSESHPNDGGMLTPIVRDGVADGWETKNLAQDYNGPHLRDGRPARDALIKFV